MGPVYPKRKNKIGRPPTRWQRVADTTPLSVKEMSETLSVRRWHTVVWREGTNEKLSSRFAAVRVRRRIGMRRGFALHAQNNGC